MNQGPAMPTNFGDNQPKNEGKLLCCWLLENNKNDDKKKQQKQYLLPGRGRHDNVSFPMEEDDNKTLYFH